MQLTLQVLYDSSYDLSLLGIRHKYSDLPLVNLVSLNALRGA